MLRAQPLHQPLHQPLAQRHARSAGLAGKRFGCLVQRIEMVLLRKEKVAHLLEGHGPQLRQPTPFVAQVLGQGFQPGLGLCLPAVQGQQGAAHGGHLGHQLVQLGQGHCLATRVVSQRLTQTGRQPGLVVVGELLHVHTQRAADAQQHRHRQGALVLLDLVEVAGRQPQHLRQRTLGHAAFFAQATQATQAHTHKSLLHRGVPFAGLFAKFAFMEILVRNYSLFQKCSPTSTGSAS